MFGIQRVPLVVDSRWFQGTADIVTYALDELLATKLRALYQRKKGRDLFDLANALNTGTADPDRIVAAFTGTWKGTASVTRAQFERNMKIKLGDSRFGSDLGLLLARGYSWDIAEAPGMLRHG